MVCTAEYSDAGQETTLQVSICCLDLVAWGLIPSDLQVLNLFRDLCFSIVTPMTFLINQSLIQNTDRLPFVLFQKDKK